MKKIWFLIKNHVLLAVVLVGILVVVGVVATRLIRAATTPLTKKYQTAVVTQQDISQIVSASGSVEAENKATLKFPTSGRLAWVGVQEGDWVKPWQVLASLDKHDLEKTLVRALRDYALERNDFEQEYRVTYQGQTPQTALTDTVKRLLEKNQWDLDKAVADVEIADYAVKMATLTSPIEGLVTEIKNAVPGSNIVYTTTEFTVVNPKVMKFVANADELDIGKIQLGQSVTVFLDAYPDEEFTGTVKQIGFSALTTSGGGTAFPLEIILGSNADYRFKDGMNGDCEITIAQKPAVLVVPYEAVKQKDDYQYVAVIDGRQIQEIKVETGLESDSQIEISHGLQEGQIVITGDES
ncbi:hypothetical protein COT66_00325 [Candidatus Shapirobacteria bacterium CG09_land_8_20_14_0_10_49_15]|uniref:RND efflux pump membrane fusion protein barrel-sandwich domain-containing protein n=2 Tax=Candidatus Shapironibacteriota TaxID=1752721 RepID=A0A2M8L7J6_9BACT|nr:MAG: hypothetical protein COT66_00325 [Candidatus Shapirobacteria bacterium CG09_land_8_20_14_0_10_49_15]PJE70204.1 MAG: hypothetical protein COU97_00945 [Candidatus Shapirobacteria bacterium CG10_big_fil_rev_8_21_14_0_10_48_15]